MYRINTNGYIIDIISLNAKLHYAFWAKTVYLIWSDELENFTRSLEGLTLLLYMLEV